MMLCSLYEYLALDAKGVYVVSLEKQRGPFLDVLKKGYFHMTGQLLKVNVGLAGPTRIVRLCANVL